MWEAVAPEYLRQSALDIVSQIAGRLRSPEQAYRIVQQTAALSSGEDSNTSEVVVGIPSWHVGLALLFGQLDRCFPDQDWDRSAHTYLSLAVGCLERMPIENLPPGLFGGISGVCFAAHFLSRDGSRYQRLLQTLDEILLQRATDLYGRNGIPTDGVRFSDYDLIAGPAGIGAYLLRRKEDAGVSAALEGLVDRLISLSQKNGRLGYFIPAEKQATGSHRERYPNGCIDCGLAHGVPGPLAFLALALRSGIEKPGIREALQTLATWVMEQRYQDAWGSNWPYAVTPDGADGSNAVPTRAAWCYGAPGVARALWLAGDALNDCYLRDVALDALCSVHARPIDMRGIPGPILCHGVAGLLQIASRSANETGQRIFFEMGIDAIRQLLDLYDPSSPTGFQNTDQSRHHSDNLGLLEGAAGITLALLAATTNVDPSWDHMLLLS